MSDRVPVKIRSMIISRFLIVSSVAWKSFSFPFFSFR